MQFIGIRISKQFDIAYRLLQVYPLTQNSPILGAALAARRSHVRL